MNLTTGISRSKTKLITLFLLFTIWQANAQEYIPMLGDTNVWTYSSWPWDNVAIITTEDSVYNTIKYKKILHEGWFGTQMGYTGLLREDEEKKQVWYIEPDSTKERIIYDFSLEEGDSIWLQYNADAYGGMLQDGWYFVDSIRTKLFFETERRMFYLDNPLNNDLTGFGSTRPYIEWIEGVGSNLHPTYFVIKDCASDWCGIEFIYGASILCAFKNDIHIYQDCMVFYFDDIDCFNMVDIVEYFSKSEMFEIYPNPTTSKLTINVGNINISNLHLQIYNSVGKKVLQQKITNSIFDIFTNKLPEGIYFININQKSKSIINTKFIKH